MQNSARLKQAVPLDVKLVAKIALSIAAAACIGLLLVLYIIIDDEATGYRRIIGAYNLAQQNLQPALLVFALAMIVFAGVSTWLFALYASFRVAGPLYRMTRDLERVKEQGPVALIPIRRTDCLQREWMEFDASVTVLRTHYAEFGQALCEVEAELRDDAPDSARLERALARLREKEQDVDL